MTAVATVAGERRQHEAFYWNGVKKEQKCEEEHSVTRLNGRRAEVEPESRSHQVDWRARVGVKSEEEEEE